MEPADHGCLLGAAFGHTLHRRPRQRAAAQADEGALGQAVLKRLLGMVAAVGQLVVAEWAGARVVARVTAANTLDAAAREVRVNADLELRPPSKGTPQANRNVAAVAALRTARTDLL